MSDMIVNTLNINFYLNLIYPYLLEVLKVISCGYAEDFCCLFPT